MSLGRLGTDDEKALEESISHALQSGYRLIDTAQYYGIESVVGRAIRNSGIPRSEITIVTKFWGNDHHNVAAALEKSLEALGLDYIDVFLMHWPWATTPEGEILRIHESPTFVETWKQIEKLVGDKCRSIGVCNFTQKTLDVLLEHATIVPAVNQVELHALNPTLGGDSQVAKNYILTHKIFTSIAEKNNTSTGTVSLSWAVQRGTTVIPKSSSKSRIVSNLQLITLDNDDMAKINHAHDVIENHRICNIHHLLWVEVDGRRTLQGWTEVDFGWEDEQGNWLT
ncbi:hypothetical protein NW762_014696 [Fusarium torreyae]|uniref:NADP-dependent oxidoreductase domain-containing protein n=1 Tax=Fusarium torreyae TaxID=1237075 RepID=A0A9W8RM92_9HYPO|nr:hypothetical protein NW762_014696 [Fusarium torreyae]